MFKSLGCFFLYSVSKQQVCARCGGVHIRDFFSAKGRRSFGDDVVVGIHCMVVHAAAEVARYSSRCWWLEPYGYRADESCGPKKKYCGLLTIFCFSGKVCMHNFSLILFSNLLFLIWWRIDKLKALYCMKSLCMWGGKQIKNWNFLQIKGIYKRCMHERCVLLDTYT